MLLVFFLKKPAWEAHRSPTTHAEVKKSWRYTTIFPVYISHHTATRINSFAVVRQVEMHFAHRWQSLRSLYKLPTVIDR
jgi:hypothetical protein